MAHDPSGQRFVDAWAARSRVHVALELLDDAEQIVRERRRLRRLGMRVRGEQRARDAGDARSISTSRRSTLASINPDDELPLPQPVHRHVDVVAAARGVKPAGCVLAAGVDEEALDVREEILAGAVVGRLAYRGDGDRIERLADRTRVSRVDDAAVGEHDEVGVVDGDQRGQEECLRVLEVLVEDLRHVLRIEPHSSAV